MSWYMDEYRAMGGENAFGERVVYATDDDEPKPEILPRPVPGGKPDDEGQADAPDHRGL